jgi:hypothetical protein
MGFDPSDPVSSGTSQLIDQVLQRNKRLDPYLGRYKGTGPKIADKGVFVQELTDSNFDSEFSKANNGQSAQSYIMGFYDYKNKIIHVRPNAVTGTALHESIHSLASPQLYQFLEHTAQKVSQDLVGVLAEGVTAFFTDCVLRDEGFENFNDAYRDKKKKAETLIRGLKTNQFDVIASFNFKFEILKMVNALGLTLKEYGALGNGGPVEIAKRLDALL